MVNDNEVTYRMTLLAILCPTQGPLWQVQRIPMLGAPKLNVSCIVSLKLATLRHLSGLQFLIEATRVYPSTARWPLHRSGASKTISDVRIVGQLKNKIVFVVLQPIRLATRKEQKKERHTVRGFWLIPRRQWPLMVWNTVLPQLNSSFIAGSSQQFQRASSETCNLRKSLLPRFCCCCL